jgi:hypothetical protein
VEWLVSEWGFHVFSKGYAMIIHVCDMSNEEFLYFTLVTCITVFRLLIVLLPDFHFMKMAIKRF